MAALPTSELSRDLVNLLAKLTAAAAG